MQTFRTTRTHLLRSLQKAFRLALLSNQPGAPPVDELTAMAKERATCSRRDFLSRTARMALLVGAGGVLASCRRGNTALPPMATGGRRTLRIAIVGAGMAGLNCAYQLKKAGYVSQIYESSSRVGGRVYTARDIMGEGLTTELGGEFIDSYHKDMLKLAAEFDLPLIDVHVTSEKALREIFFFGGRHYGMNDLIEAFRPYARRITEDKHTLPNFLHGNPAVSHFDNMSISQYFDAIGISGWLRQLLEVAYVTEYGLEVGEQSAVSFLSLFSPKVSREQLLLFGDSDERFKIRGGNQRLTDAIYERVKDQVLADHRLTAVSGAENGPYTLTFEKAGGAVSEVICDALVLTIPFTVLRSVAINVPLPDWKTNAIRNLGYGTNAKLMLGMTSRHWRTQKHVGYLFSDNGIQTGWDNSQLQDGRLGGYTLFFGGKAGTAVGEGTPVSQAAIYLPLLAQIWPDAKMQYNNKAERMHWPSHAHTLGSYSCYKVGQWSTVAGKEGATVGHIYFAGEHCSLESQGYMNGAAETGCWAAKAIVMAQKGKKPRNGRSFAEAG